MVICVPGGMVFVAAPSGPAAIADPVARPAATIIANNNFSPNFIFFHRVLAKLEIRARADLIRRRFDSKLEFPLFYSNRCIGPDALSLQGVQPVSVHAVFQRYSEECTVSGSQEGKPWIGNLRWLPDPSIRV